LKLPSPIYLPGEKETLRKELKIIKRALSTIIKDLLFTKQLLEKSSRHEENIQANALNLDEINEFPALVKSIGIDPGFLKDILDSQIEELQIIQVENILKKKKDVLQKVAETLTKIFKTCFDKASQDCVEAMDSTDKTLLEIKQRARQYAKLYYVQMWERLMKWKSFVLARKMLIV
jgi:hypothetical protein